MRNINKRYSVLVSAGMLLLASPLHAGDLTIPNEFTAGTPAVAAEVNANFDAVEVAVDDNDLRINDLLARVEALEAQASEPALSVETFFATDLMFMQMSGDLTVPVVTGNQTPAGTIGSGVDWHPLPALTDVPFTVDEDDTTVIIETHGEAYLTDFNAWSRLNVAIRIDGQVPENGAIESLRMVSDDNLSSGGATWGIAHATILSAGEHTFTVLVKGSAQNQSDLTLEGRSGTGYEGRIKARVMQVH